MLKKTNQKAENNKNYIHGRSKTRTYATWTAIKGRCYNKNHQDYKKFGAVGIRLCEKWHTFEGFLEDMGDQNDGTRLLRKDNGKDFCVENCYWE